MDTPNFKDNIKLDRYPIQQKFIFVNVHMSSDVYHFLGVKN